jgi:hypothetical protein
MSTCRPAASASSPGNIIGRVQLTPVVLMEGMALAKTLLLDGGKPTVQDQNSVPSAVFSHPMLAYMVRAAVVQCPQPVAGVMVMQQARRMCCMSLVLDMPGCSDGTLQFGRCTVAH